MQLHALRLTNTDGTCGADHDRRAISSGPSWDLELRPWDSHFADRDWAGTGRATIYALERTRPAATVLSAGRSRSPRRSRSAWPYHIGKSFRFGGESWVVNLLSTIAIAAIAIGP